MNGSRVQPLLDASGTHLDDLPRAELVQDVCEIFPDSFDSKPNPGKVERSKATRGDALRGELTGTCERDDVILSQRQNLHRQGYTTLVLTIGLMPL